MTLFGERQLSLERSLPLEIVAFWPDDRLGRKLQVSRPAANDCSWPAVVRQYVSPDDCKRDTDDDRSAY